MNTSEAQLRAEIEDLQRPPEGAPMAAWLSYYLESAHLLCEYSKLLEEQLDGVRALAEHYHSALTEAGVDHSVLRH